MKLGLSHLGKNINLRCLRAECYKRYLGVTGSWRY